MLPSKTGLTDQVEVQGRSLLIVALIIILVGTKLMPEEVPTATPMEIPTVVPTGAQHLLLEAQHLLIVQDNRQCLLPQVVALETRTQGALIVAVIEVQVHPAVLLDLLLAVAAADRVEIKSTNPITQNPKPNR